MSITQVTNHVARALSRVITQFRESEEFKAVNAAFAAQAQEIEDAVFAMLLQFRNVNVATANALDQLGRLVQAPARGLKNDTVYRGWVIAQITVNKSWGQPEDLITIANAMLATYWDDVGLIDTNDTAASSFGTKGGANVSIVEALTSTGTAEPLSDVQEAKDALTFLLQVTPAGGRTILGFMLDPIVSRTDASLFRFDGANSAHLDQGRFYCALDTNR